MAEVKKIKCRVCGKLYKPCSYCQSHSDIFRWRNFACSRECANKYINEAMAYRKDKTGTKSIADKPKVIADISNQPESGALQKSPIKKKQKEAIPSGAPVNKTDQQGQHENERVK